MKYSFTHIISAILLATGLSACNNGHNHSSNERPKEQELAGTEIRLTAENVEASGPYLLTTIKRSLSFAGPKSWAGRRDIF